MLAEMEAAFFVVGGMGLVVLLGILIGLAWKVWRKF